MRAATICFVLLFSAVAGALRAATPSAEPTFSVPGTGLPNPLVLIAYGDMRFTEPSEVHATNPAARQALAAKIATENPAAIFINGDIPWHGIAEDYAVFRDETRGWRERHLRVFPALGNHEFAACMDVACLERWWNTFPELRGRRWYSVALGSKVLGLCLDTDTSLLPGSPQRLWLESQVAALSSQVRLVLLIMHHPPVADLQSGPLADHNPRPNELSLVEYLKRAAASSPARFVVSAGHIHNYERFAADGVVYLVSGGGGAAPYQVERTSPDWYRGPNFPNYHYVRFELRGDHVVAEMIRLADYADAAPQQWETQDRFEITLRP